LRDRVVEALSKEDRGAGVTLNVLVQNGVVELRGAMPNSDVAAKLVEAARKTPGVKEVVDRLVVIGSNSDRN